METRISIFDKVTNKRLCFLENSYNIGYTLNLNGLHTARFTLPANDTKNDFCKPLNYVELWDGDKRIDLFRILPSVFTKTSEQRNITYDCEHVLATLMDDVLFGFHAIGNVGIFTPQVVRYVLDRQTVKRWNLQECDFSNQFLYTWENENLLSALFSIANPLAENYIWRLDTTNMNAWQISLKKREMKQKDELRYQKNMNGIKKTVDPSTLTTRLYLLGYGEGDNQLNVSEVNGGKPYIDADTINQYGLISKIAVDRRFQQKEALLEYGKNLLDELKHPYYSYEVDAAISINANVGDTVRVIDDEEAISELMVVTSIDKADITAQPKVKYNIANKPKDVAGTIADLADRQRIADLYAQGATNLDSRSYADNADQNNPAVMRFYLPAELVRINKLILNFRLSAFRGYTQGTSAGGQTASTTSGGGGSTQTSSSGGGSSRSTSSGGGTSSTTTSGGGTTVSSTYRFLSGYGIDSVSTSPSHSHTATVDGKSGSTSSDGSHTHLMPNFAMVGEVPSHSHSFTVSSHQHDVTIPAHTHDINIPSHEHGFSIPQHTHATIYGIYQGGTAQSATLRVDGKNAGAVQPNADIDIVNYLSKDGGGKIQRGTWHTVEVVPNALTRVEADIMMQIYVQSHGGGDY
jgi:phage minor structural protein